MKETFKTYKENVYSVVLVVNIFIALFFTKPNANLLAFSTERYSFKAL